MKNFIFVILLLISSQVLSQKKRPISDSIVDITYTDGTKRRMVWVNDSTVLLILSDKKGRITSKTYIDPEIAEIQKKIHYIIKFD